ncbi:hypothetical protein P7C71_g4650, partial [Lecanoromycetidae sp. Uapishka_2]
MPASETPTTGIERTTGLLTGGVQALLRSSPTPTLFAIASSFQWFALGSTFWATRSTILYTYYPNPTPSDRLSASSYAGGITGGVVGGLLRGRRNVIPGTIMFTMFGFLGQMVYNRLDARHSDNVAVEVEAVNEGKVKKEKGFWTRVAEMKWSPMKALTDEEYENILREKLLRVDAEIALVDEQVEKLRADEIRAKEEGTKDS